MASMGENLYTFITSSTGVAKAFTDAGAVVTNDGAVEQNTIREDPPLPWIWFGRESENEDLDFAGNGLIGESLWDVECYSDDIDEVHDVVAAVKTRLHGHRGSFGAGSVHGIFVTDHDDEYVPKGNASEEGIFVAALRARILFSST